jgi:hypothetical protein
MKRTSFSCTSTRRASCPVGWAESDPKLRITDPPFDEMVRLAPWLEGGQPPTARLASQRRDGMAACGASAANSRAPQNKADQRLDSTPSCVLKVIDLAPTSVLNAAGLGDVFGGDNCENVCLRGICRISSSLPLVNRRKLADGVCL